jgi:thioesterase DpgC
MNTPVKALYLPDMLRNAGLPADDIAAWTTRQPQAGKGWPHDLESFSSFWSLSNSLLSRLPEKSKRSEREQLAAQALLDTGRETREQFLAEYCEKVYDSLTDRKQKFLRMEDLVSAAAVAFPGLTPDAATLEKENQFVQKDKDGHEIDQGIFLAHVLANQACGLHLCHAMLLPHPKTHAYLEEFRKTGRVDLGTAYVERRGRSAISNLRNPRFLNAEDDTTVDAQEIAVDICILDEDSEVAVMRGAPMETGKYKDKRAFCTGINLTQLYYGKVSLLWYLKRELGFINKVFRGIASPDCSPDEILGKTHEKLWIAAIDAFAIGGGCQYLLVMDVNIAAKDAYLTLPARKEGIVPGAANMRLPRFVGDRIARQAVMMERRIDCDSPEGRMICDHIAEPGMLDAAIDNVVDGITCSGVVSASSNRKSFRVAHEPLDAFRRYMSVYAHEQAYCHFSPALIRNLEKFWDAQNRRT